MFRVQRAVLLGVCGVGIPAAVQNLLNVTGMTVLNNFTSVFGSDAVAAMGITQKVNMVPMYIAMGLSQGVMPLVSYTYASGAIKRMKGTVMFSARISVAFLTAVMVFYYVCAGPLTQMFMQNEAIVAYGASFLRGFCLALPFYCVDFLAVGVFQATGMGREAFLFAVLRKIALEIPALFVLNWMFPLYGLAYAQPLAELVLCAAAVLVLARLFKRLEGRLPGPRAWCAAGGPGLTTGHAAGIIKITCKRGASFLFPARGRESLCLAAGAPFGTYLRKTENGME